MRKSFASTKISKVTIGTDIPQSEPGAEITDFSSNAARLTKEGTLRQLENAELVTPETVAFDSTEYLNDAAFDWQIPSPSKPPAEILGNTSTTSNYTSFASTELSNTARSVLDTIEAQIKYLPSGQREEFPSYLQSILTGDNATASKFEDELLSSVDELISNDGLSALQLPDATRVFRTALSSLVELTGDTYGTSSYNGIIEEIKVDQLTKKATDAGLILGEVEKAAIANEAKYLTHEQVSKFEAAQKILDDAQAQSTLDQNEASKALVRSVRFENGKLRTPAIAELSGLLSSYAINQKALFTAFLNKLLNTIKSSDDFKKVLDALKTMIKAFQIWEALECTNFKNLKKNLDSGFNASIEKSVSNYVFHALDSAVEDIGNSILKGVSSMFDSVLEQTDGLEFLVEPLMNQFLAAYSDTRSRIEGISREAHAAFQKNVSVHRESITSTNKHSVVLSYIHFLKMLVSSIESIGDITDVQMAIVRIKAAWDYRS